VSDAGGTFFLMKAFIMAGGRGSRAAEIASDIPKPMIPIFGKPILEHQIDCLKKNNITDITIVIGHLGNQIKNYFGSGSRFNCGISYFNETEPLGTAGALYKMKKLPEDFLLINGDIIFDLDFSRMIAFHTEKKAWATLAVHPNSHPFDSALIVSDDNAKITGWLNKEDKRSFYKNRVNAGVHILSAALLRQFPAAKEKIDLDRDVLKPAIVSQRLFAYHTPEYIKDMGTPERFSQVSADMEKGLVTKKNLKVKQKCVFLDRDGTINTLNVFIKRHEDFVLMDGAAQAIRKINGLGYLCIVVTNQPVIARGEINFETLDIIHQKMETELGKAGAYIDDIFFCPHHPDKGFTGERPELKIDCECRKPKPGMLLKAAEKYNIDLSESFMAGDSMRDIEAGLAAGCTPVFTGSSASEECTAAMKKGAAVFPDLAAFAEFLVQQRRASDNVDSL
jgi:D,D-heptose 1,7-bisphosphate phosphatase